MNITKADQRLITTDEARQFDGKLSRTLEFAEMADMHLGRLWRAHGTEALGGWPEGYEFPTEAVAALAFLANTLERTKPRGCSNTRRTCATGRRFSGSSPVRPRRCPMPADTITVSREDAYEAVAWLFAFEELFTAIDEQVPSSLGDEWNITAQGLLGALTGGRLEDLDDEAQDTDPELVELQAHARDLAAQLVRRHVADRGPDSYMFTYYRSAFTELGLHQLAGRLSEQAMLSRAQGTMWPRTGREQLA